MNTIYDWLNMPRFAFDPQHLQVNPYESDSYYRFKIILLLVFALFANSMIVWHKLQCIFIAIPKTATHAIRFCLRKYLDKQRDWEQVGLFIHRKSPFAELAKIDTEFSWN